MEFNEETLMNLALLGLSDKEIAETLDLDVDDFEQQAQFNPIVKATLRKGRRMADASVAAALHKRATGYEYTTERMSKDGEVVELAVHVPPDTGAATRWLAQKRPETWKESKNLDHSGQISFADAMKEFDGA